jgi:hypothetical protein
MKFEKKLSSETTEPISTKLKIKQFWPFEEISIFSNGSHLGWRVWLLDIIFKGNPLRMIQAKFGLNWPSGFRGEDLIPLPVLELLPFFHQIFKILILFILYFKNYKRYMLSVN